MDIIPNENTSKKFNKPDKDKKECEKPIEERVSKTVNLPRRWSELSYSGETRIPQGLDPGSGSWYTYFLRKSESGLFTTMNGNPISFEIQNPNNFNFDESLLFVKQVLKNLTPHQREAAEYWGEGPATKQWTPIIDRLIDTYNFTPVRAARVLAAVQAGINDSFMVTWYFKYLWDVPRPKYCTLSSISLIASPNPKVAMQK